MGAFGSSFEAPSALAPAQLGAFLGKLPQLLMKDAALIVILVPSQGGELCGAHRDFSPQGACRQMADGPERPLGCGSGIPETPVRGVPRSKTLDLQGAVQVQILSCGDGHGGAATIAQRVPTSSEAVAGVWLQEEPTFMHSLSKAVCLNSEISLSKACRQRSLWCVVAIADIPSDPILVADAPADVMGGSRAQGVQGKGTVAYYGAEVMAVH